MTDYDHELRMAEIEAERRAVLELADAYAKLDHHRAMTEVEHDDMPGQLRLVIG